ncbi:MAG: hypothetical protein K6A97_04365 [Lachnospiraceae bacterium]|nr:hypothetical protein [Lachnospiraceae bacterium]
MLIFAIFCLWVYYESHRTVNKAKKEEETFWEREEKANSTRRKPIDHLDYIKIPDDLPFGLKEDNVNISSYNKIVSELKGQKILNLTGYTNTDLKLEYGAPNITELSRYDQNYTTLVTTLQKWADELSNLNEEDAAFRIMEYMIEIKCDIGKTYRMLGKKYLKENNTEAFDNLIKIISGTRSMNKEYIKASLEEMRTKAEE